MSKFLKRRESVVKLGIKVKDLGFGLKKKKEIKEDYEEEEQIEENIYRVTASIEEESKKIKSINKRRVTGFY